MFSLLIAMIIGGVSGGGFHHGLRVGAIVASISDRIYSVFARLFIAVSNASIRIDAPVFNGMDRDVD